MARAGITYHDVLRAIKQCQEQGQKPSVERCRAILGTGSQTTIHNYLKRWREEQDFVGGADASSLPAELVDTIKSLWERLCADSQQQVTLAKQTWESARLELQQQIETLEHKNSEQTQYIDNIEKQLTQAHTDHEQLAQQRRSLEDEKLTLTTDNHALQKQLSDSQSETNRLHELVKHVQTNLEHYQTEAQNLREAQNLVLDKQRQTHEHELRALEETITTLKGTNAQLDAKLQQHAHQLGDEKNGRVRLEKAITALQADNTQMKNALQQTQLSLKQTEMQLNDKATLLVQTERTNNELVVNRKVCEQRMAALETEIQKAQKTCENLQREKITLLQNNAHLKGQLKQLTLTN